MPLQVYLTNYIKPIIPPTYFMVVTITIAALSIFLIGYIIRLPWSNILEFFAKLLSKSEKPNTTIKTQALNHISRAIITHNCYHPISPAFFIIFATTTEYYSKNLHKDISNTINLLSRQNSKKLKLTTISNGWKLLLEATKAIHNPKLAQLYIILNKKIKEIIIYTCDINNIHDAICQNYPDDVDEQVILHGTAYYGLQLIITMNKMDYLISNQTILPHTQLYYLKEDIKLQQSSIKSLYNSMGNSSKSMIYEKLTILRDNDILHNTEFLEYFVGINHNIPPPILEIPMHTTNILI